ncbi:hypothetical protein RFI_14928 [Reticulomyxa filosa]|uniref:Peptidase A1 domain-containing protein n=1 Tax=Reticulomyxa filosa TaxID=46433 RepID=X6NAD3_RETFI|nr:hypothetical protein RFI_14928 [Reticulomyxa filosa]|eukprot:ETO22272.1 hypothetical protein RFI_14928 [Reticulomyxa filosa]
MANFFNKMYTAELQIGTPKQKFAHVVLDTGSADLWVLSSQAKGHGVPSASYLNYYNHDKSTTYYGPVSKWSIQYGSGKAQGYTAKDVVYLSNDLKSEGFTFAEATYVEDMEMDELEPQDGICGFARGSASTIEGSTTLTESLTAEGEQSTSVFAFYLTKHNEQGSKLVIGANDKHEGRYFKTDTMKYVPITDDYGYDVSGLWGFEIVSISISFDDEQKSVALWDTATTTTTTTTTTSQSKHYGIVDTGTTYIGVPQTFYDALMKHITKKRTDCFTQYGSTYDSYVCQDVAHPSRHLPHITFQMYDEQANVQKFTLTAGDYMDDGLFVLTQFFFKKKKKKTYIYIYVNI